MKISLNPPKENRKKEERFLIMGDNAAPEIESDSWCRSTSGDKVSTTFTWTIEDFLSRPEKSGEAIYSSPFTVSGPNDQVTTWDLQMYPKGRTPFDTDLVSLFIRNIDKTTEKATVSFSILNEWLQKKKRTTNIVKGAHLCGVVYISVDELNENPDLLPSGHLTIVCELTMHGPGVTISGSKFPDEELATDDNCGKQMNEQVGKLFGKTKFSDVKITCGEEVFYCHRCILSVSSSVFEAMFLSDMTENISRIVNIKDIKPEVVKEMLYFIYNGETLTENSTHEFVMDLLRAADQYKLNLLKVRCEERLCSILEVSNSVELLVLADLHGAPKLRRMALRMVTRNIFAIIFTDAYEELNDRHPSLVLEIIKALAQTLMINTGVLIRHLHLYLTSIHYPFCI